MFILNFIKLVINFIIKMSSNNSFEIIKQFVQQQLANLMLVSNKEPENPSISDSSSSLSRSESSISELESTTTDSSRIHSDHSSAISISTDSQETIERGGDRGKKRRRKFEFLIIDEEKRCYTSDEIKSMNEYELIEAFRRVTGKQELSCTHCKRYTSLGNWVHSIRKRCEKKGLNPELSLPKTCDKQQAINSICNPINNKVYHVLRKDNCDLETHQELMNDRNKYLKKIGIVTCPYKY
jgi:hypothetical protein